MSSFYQDSFTAQTQDSLCCYRRIIEQMTAYGINIPVIAIGGILLQDVPDIMQTGVSGVAISGAILNANNDDNPVTTMKRFINELKSNNK